MFFAGSTYYPGGGMVDFVSTFEDERAVYNAMHKWIDEERPSYAWMHLYDTQAGKITREWSFDCGVSPHLREVPQK
jgi:hypothetical protein